MNEQQIKALTAIICSVLDYLKNKDPQSDRVFEQNIEEALKQVNDSKVAE